jgi:hypothetical protein
MYGTFTRLIKYVNIRKNARRHVQCTAARDRVQLYCACLLGSLQPLDTLTFSIRTSLLELWKQSIEQRFHSDHPVYRMNLLITCCIQSDHLFARMFSAAVLSKKQEIPLQSLTGPEGSRRLRLPDFKTIGT